MTHTSPLVRMPRDKKSQAGSSLVELMVTIAVFAIGLVSLLTGMVAVVNHQKISATKQRTFNEIQNQFIALDGNIPGGQGALTFDVNSPTAIELTGLPGSSITLSIVDDKGNADPSDDEIHTLPMTNIADYDSVTPPDPVEIIIDAFVPANAAQTQFYRFRMSRLMDI